MSIARFLVLASLLLTTVVLGQSPKDPTAFDLNDPVNIEERRLYLLRWMDAIDSGINATPFEFTNEFDGPVYLLFTPELRILEVIYSHRINTSGTGTYYSVLNLLADDSIVRQSFAHYVQTKEFETDASVDATAAMNHFGLIIEAMLEAEKYFVEACAVHQNVLSSQGLIEKEAEAIPAPPPLVTPDPCFDYWLKFLATKKAVDACLSSSGATGWRLFLNVKDVKKPDFDCDDFAWMQLWWLKRALERVGPVDLILVGYGYKCSNGKVSGHMFVLVRSGDKFYLVDPQSGLIIGPYSYPVSDEQLREIIRQFFKDHPEEYTFCGPDALPYYDKPFRYKPDKFIEPGLYPDVEPENPPFDKDRNNPSTDPNENMWLRFKRKLAECCKAYPTPTPPANCTNPFDAQHPIPDPCDPNNYAPTVPPPSPPAPPPPSPPAPPPQP